MIPIRDNVPSVHPSVALWFIIMLNAAAFVFELALNQHDLVRLFHLYGLVPARYSDPLWAMHAGYPDSLLPWVTYMFLHSGWLHVILNMWMLWIFADNIEDVTGPGRFTVFYVLCGLAAVLLQAFVESGSQAPIIGASGAVAGIMGGYMVLYPHGKVHTLVPVFIIPFFFKLPAPVFLGLWFGIQILSGLFSTMHPGTQTVAWWAHVGGFLTGMFLIRFFVKKDRCYYCYNPEKKDYDLLDL